MSSDTLQQIRDRLNLVEVVRGVVPTLKRKGRADWWGCCPFHQEKSASFHIKEDAGFYHCFGCGAHGNVFDFLKETRGGTFGDAVRYAAELAGVSLAHEQADPVAEKKRQDGLRALERAAVFFQRCLKGEALAYVQKRGLTEETLKTFRLGFAPESWTDLADALLNEGFSKEILRETGLVVPPEEGSRKGDYDRFRNRVMFPIQNLEGGVVGFGGRVTDKTEPKYLNSPETRFFNKRAALFNLNRARDSIRREGRALLVEGYMDVISLWQQGVYTAVAPMGTAVTEDQVRTLWRFCSVPLVCLDGDEAGRQAAIRLAKRVLPVLKADVSLRFVWMPTGDDPDSFIRAHGKAAFERLLAQAASLEDVLWAEVLADKDVKAAEGRAAVEALITETVGQMADAGVRKAYASALKGRLWQAVRIAEGSTFVRRSILKGEAGSAPRARKSLSVGGGEKKLSVLERQARLLLSILHRQPLLTERVQEKLAQVETGEPVLQAFKEALFRFFSEGTLEKETVDTYLNSIGMAETLNTLLAFEPVSRLGEQELESFWLSSYAAYEVALKREQTFKTLGNATSLEEAWAQFSSSPKTPLL